MRCPGSCNRHPSIAPYQTFDTADRPIAVAVGNDKQFRAFSAARGLAELADDARFATNPQRVANRDALCALLEPALKAEGADYWYELFSSVGVPAGPINDLAEAFAFAQRLGNEATVSVPGSATPPQVANPISMSVTPPRIRSAPPRWERYPPMSALAPITVTELRPDTAYRRSGADPKERGPGLAPWLRT